MPAEPAARALVAQVGAFHITDPALKRVQQEIERAIAGGRLDPELLARYLTAVARYFEAFDREARAHLIDVDRRLERANQVQFNLTAERAVAVKRIEGTHAVLEALGGIREARS